MTLLDTLSAWFAPTPPCPPEVAAGLRLIGEHVGVPLTTETDFERKLAGPVAHALAYCETLVAQLPPFVDVTRSAFASDPLIHALFASADDIGTMFGCSPALREYLAEPEAWRSGHCHALLAVRRHEKRVQGIARMGDVIATDVPQRLVYFSEHALALPAIDETGARARLRAAAYESLLTTFAEHVTTLRTERQALKIERELEKARLATLRDRQPGDADLRRRTRRIDELDARLRAHADALLPGPQLDALADFLGCPERALSLRAVTLELDRSGARAGDGLGVAGEVQPVSFMELSSRDPRRHVVVPVRIACEEARLAIAEAREARERLILI